MTQSEPLSEERLPRSLGMWSAAAVLVGVTIGSGIFRVPSVVAGTLHSPVPMLLVWVVGGLVTLAGALSIAELGAMFPRSGGVFAYILEAQGPFAAFVYGIVTLVQKLIYGIAVPGYASLLIVILCHSLVKDFPIPFLLFFTFLYTPFISYVNARIIGIAPTGWNFKARGHSAPKAP